MYLNNVRWLIIDNCYFWLVACCSINLRVSSNFIMIHSSFNYSWTILLSVLTIVSCRQTTNTNPTNKKETLATLAQDDIEKIESLLTNCVTDYNNKLSANNKQYFSINMIKEKYKRQYVAVINKKRRQRSLDKLPMSNT